MIKSIQQLFETGTAEEIVSAITIAVKSNNESPFWSEKAPRYATAILSVLIPLREQQLLFSPEGRPEPVLTPALFLRWCDLVSLKTLSFILQQSNDVGLLKRTAHDEELCRRYVPIELDTLGAYLNSYMVNLQNEALDFPITHYNLHQGITDVLAQAIKH